MIVYIDDPRESIKILLTTNKLVYQLTGHNIQNQSHFCTFTNMWKLKIESEYPLDFVTPQNAKYFSSVQFSRSVMSDSLHLQGL